MMKTLLESDFCHQYATNGKPHQVEEFLINGDYSLRDEVACKTCYPFFSSSCGDETFLFHSDEHVNVIKIEEFLKTFPRLSGERCDWMFYSDEKLVLLDMYCGMSNYIKAHKIDGKIVEGKRSKVRRQITSTINRLNSVSAISLYLKEKQSKLGIFACRLKDEEHAMAVSKCIQRSIRTFTSMTDMNKNRNLSTPLVCDFKFITVKHPHRYKW